MTGSGATVELTASLRAWYGVPKEPSAPVDAGRGARLTSQHFDETYARYRHLHQTAMETIRTWALAFNLNCPFGEPETPPAFRNTHTNCLAPDTKFWVYHPEHHTWTRINPTTALAEDTEETK